MADVAIEDGIYWVRSKPGEDWEVMQARTSASVWHTEPVQEWWTLGWDIKEGQPPEIVGPRIEPPEDPRRVDDGIVTRI